MIVVGNHEMGRIIATRAGAQYNRDYDVCIARVEKDSLLGGAVFENYTGRSISMHMAGFRNHWMNRDLLWALAAYPFNQLHCETVFAPVPSFNMESLCFCYHVGFSEVTRIDDVFPDGDMIIMGIKESECKWHHLRPAQMIYEGAH